jgi:hypothetical protein
VNVAGRLGVSPCATLAEILPAPEPTETARRTAPTPPLH